MNLREALIVQSPSLALQREAQAEIARLDHQIKHTFTAMELAHACAACDIPDSLFQSLEIELNRRKKSRPAT